MTGLNIKFNHIIEISTIITDQYLNIIDEGPSITIFQPKENLLSINKWSMHQHTKSGLLDKVVRSRVSVKEAEEKTINFLKKNNIKKGCSPMCGNSVYQDRKFLAKYMKNLDSYFHYRLLDVSTIKELVFRWYPNLKIFKKKKMHTALYDIKESINELKFYQKHIFIPIKKNI